MPQQLRVTRELDASGATLIGFNPLVGAGKVFYVDQNTGNNGNLGTSPNHPLKSIQAGMDKVTDNKGDYVFVLSSKEEDDTLGVVPTDDLLRWHLVGVNVPPNIFGTVIRLDNETLDAITLNGTAGSYSEIAGFALGGGDEACGGIGLGQTMGCWIHHNIFGHAFCGDTPAYGINYAPTVVAGTNCEATLIEDNIFLGDQNNAGGLITNSGIYMPSSTPSRNIIIRRNVFSGLEDYGIYIDAKGGMILDNIFSVDENVAGAAITLGTDGSGCFVNGNSANWGGTDAMVAIPYVDNAAAADTNTWGLNYQGGTAAFPA